MVQIAQSDRWVAKIIAQTLALDRRFQPGPQGTGMLRFEVAGVCARTAPGMLSLTVNDTRERNAFPLGEFEHSFLGLIGLPSGGEKSPVFSSI